jgi:uncharacterized protein YidB (DUF937 family)
MLINFDEVANGALVNAIAVVGRQVSKAAAGLRTEDEDLATARWFESFRLTATPPDLPGLSPAAAERLAEVLGGDEIQACLQELLAVRLTDAPETDASRARDALRVAVGAAAPGTAAFSGALADYYDDQICALVARLEGEEPPLLAQIRCEAFSSRMISILQAIERHSAALAEGERRGGDGRAPSGPPAGRLLAEVTDPFDLEVHRAVQAGDAPAGLPVLPAYVPREHDRELAELVRAAAKGASGIAVLVGGSSTGKTRACWEALEPLRDQPERWRLWHPIDPSRPEAALRELPSIGPRTVVWLNEAQLYLDVAAGGLGERVAAGLRQLLRDPARGPVLVLATLWQEFWGRLTARLPKDEDPHAQARELLTGRDISVPAAFTATQIQQLTKAGDPRLARAAKAAEAGHVTQFLAGAPELTARYRNAPPAAAALITVAIDARRLGMGVALPLAFLEAAAPGYLTDADWDALGEDWLEQALAYAAAPCSGIRGPLARIRPRATRGAIVVSGPAYRLADYLEQHGRRARRPHVPPADFWKAAVRFATPADLPALARAAEDRGLYRDAARLRKHAAQGDISEAVALVRHWHLLHPDSSDPNPARWAAAQTALNDPFAVASLLDELRQRRAGEQAAALLARDPAAHAPLGNPGAVARLLKALRLAGADEQAAALLARDPAAHAALDDPFAVGWLLDELRLAGADEQAAALLARDPAAHAPLGNPGAVARLLKALRWAGADEQAAALLARDPAAHAALHDPKDVASLLDALRAAGAGEQAAVLAGRAAAHAAVDDPKDVASLLDALRAAGAGEQAAVLASRAAAHAAVDDPFAVAQLLDALRRAAADNQAAALADRVAAHAVLDDPFAVASLLNALREVGADEQAAALLARDPAAHDNLVAAAWLLNALREVGADDQAVTLFTLLPGGWAVGNPKTVVGLLNALRAAGADEQAGTLADRAASVDGSSAVGWLLDVLHLAGADDQVAVLLARDPAAHAVLDDPIGVALLLDAVREAGADDQVAVLLARDPAAHAVLDDPIGIPALLDALREAGADDQAKVLVDRLPAQGLFYDFQREAGHKVRYRFGREADGSPAPSWAWADLD